MESKNEHGSSSNENVRSEYELQEHLQATDSQQASSEPEIENGIEKGQDDNEHVLTWQKTHESQHSRILGLKPKDQQAMLSSSRMGGGKPYPPDLPGQESEYVVDFDGPHDPTHPQNWPMSTKSVLPHLSPNYNI
jgi:hypothetical protein